MSDRPSAEEGTVPMLRPQEPLAGTGLDRNEEAQHHLETAAGRAGGTADSMKNTNLGPGYGDPVALETAKNAGADVSGMPNTYLPQEERPAQEDVDIDMTGSRDGGNNDRAVGTTFADTVYAPGDAIFAIPPTTTTTTTPTYTSTTTEAATVDPATGTITASTYTTITSVAGGADTREVDMTE